MPIFNDVDTIYGTIRDYIAGVLPNFIMKVGNVVHTVAIAVSLSMEDLNNEGKEILNNVHLSTAYDDGLDLIGADYDVEREAATYAIRTFKFQRNIAAAQDYAIPAGRVVGTAVDVFGNRKTFTVNADSVLATGSTFISIPCTAQVAGAGSNISVGSEVQIIDTIPGVDFLTLVAGDSDTDGMEKEDNEVYRARIRDSIKNNAQGTVAALDTVARNIPGVQAVIVKESGTNDGIVTVYANDGVGLSTPTQNALQAALDEDKAAGITIVVAALASIDVAVVATIKIPAGYTDAEKQTIKDGITEQINFYVNSLTRGVDPVVFAKIYGIVSNGAAVSDVTALTVNAGTVNIAANPITTFKMISTPVFNLIEV